MKPFKLSMILMALIGPALFATPSQALRLPPVDHPATAAECSACHMIYPAQMLPARSWTKLMETLSDHFGEDASLAPDVQADILAYLKANAADAPASGGMIKILKGVAPEDVPLRISELPWWKRRHGEINPKVYLRPEIKSPANCIACHKTADKGEFFED